MGRQSNPTLTMAWSISLFQLLELNENGQGKVQSELYNITF